MHITEEILQNFPATEKDLYGTTLNKIEKYSQDFIKDYKKDEKTKNSRNNFKKPVR